MLSPSWAILSFDLHALSRISQNCSHTVLYSWGLFFLPSKLEPIQVNQNATNWLPDSSDFSSISWLWAAVVWIKHIAFIPLSILNILDSYHQTEKTHWRTLAAHQIIFPPCRLASNVFPFDITIPRNSFKELPIFILRMLSILLPIALFIIVYSRNVFGAGCSSTHL